MVMGIDKARITTQQRRLITQSISRLFAAAYYGEVRISASITWPLLSGGISALGCRVSALVMMAGFNRL